MTDADPMPPILPPDSGKTARSKPVILAALGVAALLGGVAVYGMYGARGKETDAGACAASKTLAAELAPFARGQIAALSVNAAPRPMAELQFEAGDGSRRALSSFRGKTVLLNLWATWCVPCREEMPALDKLQAKLGGPKFEVVALDIDTARLERRQAFLADAGIKNLAFYADPTAEAFQVMKKNGKVLGLPTTMLIDASGCELALIAGPADWASEDAVRLIEAALR